MSDPEDWDFDDPRLLQQLEQAAQPAAADLSYAERRRRKIAQSEDKGRANARSRKQQEDDTREEGLRTNLIARDTELGGESKGLKMMKSMGFKPGEALGRKQDDDGEKQLPTAGPSRGGLGFARASFAPVGGAATPEPPTAAPQAEKRRTEPIKFEMREARTGLGVPQPKRLRTFPSHLLPLDSSSTPLPDLEGYLASLKTSIDARRAFGLLRSARRTCEELDRRAGVEDSPMWRDPEEEEREKTRLERRRVFDRVDDELDSDDERKVGDKEARDKKRSARRGGGDENGLAYETGLSDTVVDVDPPGAGAGRSAADVEEEEEWFSMDVQSRLGLTLAYLRRKYNYCLWCGCQYDDAADLAQHCPGEEEELH
ncbi:hypothetical protein JCM6882_003713 [Rhodosporidiobolus microsporus]